MSEGSLDAPIRHPIPWTDDDFYDEEKLDEEMRRVFDICHGCRRCFNLCDSFPRLFDLIDESESGELDTVESKDFKPVADACTLCDMCFMTKCPYVPPHEFNLDFPHLMLRIRAVEQKAGQVGFAYKQLAETDRNGRLCSHVSGPANWASNRNNKLTRPIMEALTGVHRDAALPAYAAKPLTESPPTTAINESAPAHGRKAVLYATCFSNYNRTATGHAAQAVLAKNGVETAVVYPRCCGMPQLEQGDIARVAEHAREVSAELAPWIERGYDIVALTPSCALMLKFEWPLILPEDEGVGRLSAATLDISEYVIDIAKKEGLADGLTALPGGVTLHMACHARAQNIGQKAAELLRLIPETEVQVIERCSGHGGAWGVMRENFDTAIKTGRPVARKARQQASRYIVSECPLAGAHILQGMESVDGDAPIPKQAPHPIELLAAAYGFDDGGQTK